MAPSSAQDPFRSARLFYRAVRGPEDDAFFAQINEDRTGYMNSNASNCHLPTPADAERFRKGMEDNLLSAIICLPHEEIPGFPPTPGLPIGQVHLNGIPRRLAHHRNTELGIDILPAFQGCGYGSEAIRWALHYAFQRAGMHKVRIRAFGWNEGAVRLYARLGFVEEGREREALWHEGRWWDGVEMGMVEGEWRAMEEERKRGEEKKQEEGKKKDESGVPMI